MNFVIMTKKNLVLHQTDAVFRAVNLCNEYDLHRFACLNEDGFMTRCWERVGSDQWLSHVPLKVKPFYTVEEIYGWKRLE